MSITFTMANITWTLNSKGQEFPLQVIILYQEDRGSTNKKVLVSQILSMLQDIAHVWMLHGW